MNFKYKYTFYLILGTILSSCGPTEKETRIAPKEKQEIENQRIISENNRITDEMNKEYSALSGWDTTSDFSYSLQEKLTKIDQYISFNGELIDIIKVDSGYTMKIYHELSDLKFGIHGLSSYSSEYLAFVEVSKTQIAVIENELSKNKERNGCFILKVSAAVPLSHKVSTKGDIDGDECNYYFETDVESSLMILKATLVDFYLNQKHEKRYRRF